MPFDGIVTRAVAQELNHILGKGKIEKIYQPEKDELIFQVHTSIGKRRVYASCNNNHPGIFLTNANYDNPTTPSGFCMLLRKHLQSARIISITQKDAERIIEIQFETRDELGFSVNKKMIFEIMGKHSNIVLVRTDNNKIIDSIKRVSIDVNRARQILPGLTYEYPPLQDKISFDVIDPKVLPSTADEILNKVQGISPLIAREIAVDPQNKLEALRNILKSNDLSPAVYLNENNKPVDFHVLDISEYQDMYKILSFDSVSETINYYYNNRDVSNRIKQKSINLSKFVANYLKKLYLKKQRLSEDLLKAENSDRYKLFGELLTANLHSIKTGDTKASVINYYNQETIDIPLDKRFAPSKNAQIYFKKYAKAKTAIKEKQIQLTETQKDIDYMESVASFIENAQSTEDIDNIREELSYSGFAKKRNNSTRTKKSHPKPHEYTTSDGLKILVGRNNRENDILTFKTASKNDFWFHTKDIPGSHVILFTNGKEPSDISIFETAALAAYHSKGKESENVPVDYTLVRHVKKPSGAKPGMVIFTDNKTVYVTPKEIL